jgi:cytochrome P450
MDLIGLGAGADTTAATLNSFVLAITVFPDALAGAHEELDRVVGPNRLPTFDDEDKLPYIRAMVKETLRWRPVAVLGGTVFFIQHY